MQPDQAAFVVATNKRRPEVSNTREDYRKQQKRHQKENKNLARNRQQEDGFTLLARGKVRQDGGVVAVGSDRTCLADAVRVLLHLCGIVIKQPLVRKALHRAHQATIDGTVHAHGRGQRQ